VEATQALLWRQGLELFTAMAVPTNFVTGNPFSFVECQAATQ